MSWIHLDFAQLITSVLLAGIVYGIKQVHSLISGFINRVNDNETTLDATSEMVDRHSVSLVRAKLLDAPVKKVHMGRRTGDRAIFIVDDEIHMGGV